jgi:hypothetical protein
MKVRIFAGIPGCAFVDVEWSTPTEEEILISRDAAGNMVVIRSFPFGCTTEHVDAVISTSSYREAGNCDVVWR